LRIKEKVRLRARMRKPPFSGIARACEKQQREKREQEIRVVDGGMIVTQSFAGQCLAARSAAAGKGLLSIMRAGAQKVGRRIRAVAARPLAAKIAVSEASRKLDAP
jgi:hypothetical protein